MVAPRHDQVGTAFIIDNADGSMEVVRAKGRNIQDATIAAYVSAVVECNDRNEREALPLRFVPVQQNPRRPR